MEVLFHYFFPYLVDTHEGLHAYVQHTHRGIHIHRCTQPAPLLLSTDCSTPTVWARLPLVWTWAGVWWCCGMAAGLREAS